MAQYRNSTLAIACTIRDCEVKPIPATRQAAYYQRMDLGILFSIIGFALLVAALDFIKRRAARRVPQPQPVAAAEPSIAAPIGGIAAIPRTGRTVPSLAVGKFLPLPKPNPRLPRHSVTRGASVSWWREA